MVENITFTNSKNDNFFKQYIFIKGNKNKFTDWK